MKRHNLHSTILAIITGIIGGFTIRHSQSVELAGILGGLTMILIQTAKEIFGTAEY